MGADVLQIYKYLVQHTKKYIDAVFSEHIVNYFLKG